MHIWTFLTTVPSSFKTISASSLSLSQSSFRLNKTFPCHGTLKVVNMCMSNTMNMDVTSFFGAWPPACPHAGSPHPDSPPRHKTLLLNEHSMQRRHTDTHGGVIITGTPAHISAYESSCALAASRVLFLTDLSQCVLRENKGQRRGKILMWYLFMCINLESCCTCACL